MKNLSPGKNPPEQVNVFIEIPQGSSIKYELDKESGVIFVDRFLYTAYTYPFNYGFIPGTQADDGDPVDVLVLCDKAVQAGCVIPVVPIGMLEMEDEEGIDTKIIAVPTKKVDPDWGAYQDISEISQAIKDKMKHFFEHYKELEPGKWVKIRDWKGKKEAHEDIQKSLK
ncbi:inorganic diphosphatase [Candidatus Gottesmanbacteria bacterium]|nr:inorganic diphosphatase [Candidatus Gottesmanbacteria bacterium]